jgi:hypothetical protein
MKSLLSFALSAFLSIFPTPAGADTLPYKTREISDTAFYLSRKNTVYLDVSNTVEIAVSIKYGLDSDTANLADWMVRYGVRASWDVVSNYLDQRGISRSFCRYNEYNINIFIVDLPYLADHSRFYNIYQSESIRQQSIYLMYAYYDSTPYIDNNSAIIFADISWNSNLDTFVHEMTHYWWDRLCLGTKMPNTDTETFSRKIEEIYLNYYK